MYEIGDKVIYQGADRSAYKRVGVLKSIEEKDGKPQLTVEFDDGETFTAPVDDWSKEFSNACRNAKFKIGDKVTWEGSNYVVLDIRPSGGYAIGESDLPGWVAVVKEDKLVPGWHARGRTSNSCTSTNSVVRNAMAAKRVARNANLTPQYITNQLKDLLSMMKSVKIDYGKAKESDRSIKKKLMALSDSVREDRKFYDSAPESDKRAWDSTYNEILNISPFGAM